MIDYNEIMANTIFPDGVHAGKTWKHVRTNHPEYLEHLKGQIAGNIIEYFDFIKYCLEFKEEKNEYKLYFDGCSKKNPGKAGAGAVLYYNNEEIWAECIFVGSSETSNKAEYSGLLLGLEYITSKKIKNITIYGDSLLVIKQMNGEYKVNSDNIWDLHMLAKKLVNELDEIKFVHVKRELNKRADRLSNMGLEKEIS